MPTGKVNISYRKKETKDSKVPVIGLTNLVFAHQAGPGDVTIPFAALNPPIEWGLAGYVNPDAAELLAAPLSIFKQNIVITSSLGHVVNKTEYIVLRDQIKFSTFSALADEVFTVVVSDIVVNGILVVDARPIYKVGLLANLANDFNVGDAFPAGQDPQRIEVYKDEVLQYRNTDNSNTTLDKDYYEVRTFGQLGSTIRFNTAGTGVEVIVVKSIGSLAERPSVNMMQNIEVLGAQLDKVVDELSPLSGQPPSFFQAQPNEVDLTAFGDRVYALEQALNSPTKYFGDPDTDGSYRIDQSGTALVIERRELGVWVNKGTFV